MKKILVLISFIIFISCTEDAYNPVAESYYLEISKDSSVLPEYLNLSNEFYDYNIALKFSNNMADFDSVKVTGEILDNNETVYSLTFFNDGRNNETGFDLIPDNNVFSARIFCEDLKAFSDKEFNLVFRTKGFKENVIYEDNLSLKINIKTDNTAPVISGAEKIFSKDSLLSGFQKLSDTVLITDPDYNPADNFENIYLQLVVTENSVTAENAFKDSLKSFNYSELIFEDFGEIAYLLELDSSFTCTLPTGLYNLFIRATDRAEAKSNILEKKLIFLENSEPLLSNPQYKDTVYVNDEVLKGKISICASDKQSLKDIKRVTANFEREGVEPLPAIELLDNGAVEDSIAGDGIFTTGLTYPNLEEDETQRVYTITFNAEDYAGNIAVSIQVQMVIRKMEK